jgi:hypothetical protein
MYFIYLFCVELGSTRTGNFMCRRALPAGFGEISSMPGSFQYDYRGEIGNGRKAECGGGVVANKMRNVVAGWWVSGGERETEMHNRPKWGFSKHPTKEAAHFQPCVRSCGL